MKIKSSIPILFLMMIAICGLTACQVENPAPTENLALPTATTSNQSHALATPYAQQPAAGICASFEGEMVVVSINPDMPEPRCSKVRPDQTLKVINQTQNTLQVSIGSFQASLEPGEETVFDTPFGEYLAPGVHQLRVLPCCGPELWLESNQ